MTNDLKMNANFNSAFELESDDNCREGEFLLHLKGIGKAFPAGLACVGIVRQTDFGFECSMKCTKKLYRHHCEIRQVKESKTHTQVLFKFDSADEFHKWALKCGFAYANRQHGSATMICNSVPGYAKG